MLSVWTAVLDIEDEASPCRRVVSGLSWGSRDSSVNVPELTSEDTAREAPEAWSVLTKSLQFLLLPLASVVATTRVEVSGSVDRLMASSDLLLVSVKVCVCSVSKFPAAAVCVSAVCVSRMFLCDGDKLSLDCEVAVALFSTPPSSSAPVACSNPDRVTESVLLSPGVPAPRGPGNSSRRTDRDRPRT